MPHIAAGEHAPYVLKSVVTLQRRDFIRNTGLAVGAVLTAPSLLRAAAGAGDTNVPLLDLHVHTTGEYPIERVLELAEKRGVKLGIVEHPTSWALKDDAALRRYIDTLRKYPVYIGLQPVDFDWRSRYSASLLAEVDYVLQDPQIFRMADGEAMQIWEFSTYVADADAFMERYMEHSLFVLRNANIDIFGWPLFLPVCIARDYYRLWTAERMNAIIAAAKENHVAIEINDMAHTPHDEFIRMAKDAGLKFTIGSDSRNQNVGRLDYTRGLIKRCGLTASDFWVPTRKGGSGRSRG